MDDPAVIVVASNGDDWEGLYIDGILVREGNAMYAQDFASELPLMRPIKSITWKNVDLDWLAYEVDYSLPKKIEEVVWE